MEAVAGQDIGDRREQLTAFEQLEVGPQAAAISASHRLLRAVAAVPGRDPRSINVRVPIGPVQGMIFLPTTVLIDSMLRRYRIAVSRYCLTLSL